jgi:CheY-like chemotaxis protein/anti-sigma regulatory factor (Ser/Thr protein kinase)
MNKILIVDDCAVDRQLAGRLLEKQSDLVPIYATSGREALDLIEKEHPQAVLTDMQMPEFDGLELVLQIRNAHPETPVILMTAHGSESIAVRALQSGAASYVPKSCLSHDLFDTIAGVLEASQAKKVQRDLMKCRTFNEDRFVLDNDCAFIAPLVGHVKDSLVQCAEFDENTQLRITVAVREALSNAIEHGNLELNSNLRENSQAYHALADERRRQEPYRNRRVTFTARQRPHEVVYIVRDQGPGFNPADLPDPTDPGNLDKISGRGLLLIRTFMSEVSFNESGTEITMTRRSDTSDTRNQLIDDER